MKKLLTVLITCLLWSCTAIAPSNMYSVKLDAETFEKVGKSTCIVWFNFLPVGDCGIQAAMDQGGIKRVHHIDKKVENYLILQKITTIVYGDSRVAPATVKGKTQPKDNADVFGERVPCSNPLDVLEKMPAYKIDIEGAFIIYCNRFQFVFGEETTNILFTARPVIVYNALINSIVITTANSELKLKFSDSKEENVRIQKVLNYYAARYY